MEDAPTTGEAAPAEDAPTTGEPAPMEDEAGDCAEGLPQDLDAEGETAIMAGEGFVEELAPVEEAAQAPGMATGLLLSADALSPSTAFASFSWDSPAAFLASLIRAPVSLFISNASPFPLKPSRSGKLMRCPNSTAQTW